MLRMNNTNIELEMKEERKEDPRHVYYIEGVPIELIVRDEYSTIARELLSLESISMKQIAIDGYVITSTKEHDSQKWASSMCAKVR